MRRRFAALILLLCLFACSDEPAKLALPQVSELLPAKRFAPYKQSLFLLRSGGTDQRLAMLEETERKLTEKGLKAFKISNEFELLGIPLGPAGEYKFDVGGIQNKLVVVEQPHALPDMPVACDFACACTHNGKIYLFGGRTDVAIFTGHANSYDPASKKWEELPGMPHPKQRASAVSLGGKIYVIGGYSGEESVLVDVFDPGKCTWADGPMLSTARFAGCAAAAGGKIYFIGGWITCRHEVSDG